MHTLDNVESLSRLEIGLHPDLAADLFRDGVISLGMASKLSGLSMGDFIQHLGHFGIEIARVDETTAHETKDLSAWL